MYWQSRKSEQIPRVANRANDCRVECWRGLPAATGVVGEGGCREGCCQLEWTAQDLPSTRAQLSLANPATVVAAAASFKQLRDGLICRGARLRPRRRARRKRKNHPVALLVEA